MQTVMYEVGTRSPVARSALVCGHRVFPTLHIDHELIPTNHCHIVIVKDRMAGIDVVQSLGAQ